MSLVRKFSFAAGLALFSTGVLAGTAADNEFICMAVKDDPNIFSLPDGKEKEVCKCVGQHSELMLDRYSNISNSDAMMKGYHKCLPNESISQHFSRLGYSLIDSVGYKVAGMYANCLTVNGRSEGIQFAYDGRREKQFMSKVTNSCQYILNMNAFFGMFGR